MREPRRQKRRIIYIFSEGKTNKTEQIYFHNFVNRCRYTIHFKRSNETDAKGILSFAQEYLELQDFSAKEGDRAFIVCDVDTEEKRQVILRSELVVKARKVNITFIFSNPCFELWFLNHFRYTTKQFSDSESLIAELKKEIPSYSKSPKAEITSIF